MKTPAPIHIFRPGTHTDVSGKTLSFGEAELEASAKAYDPALHEAPLVVGHPSIDAPAYGWVSSLSFSQDGLAAQPHQVDAEFAELVRGGRFKKISASFYTPDAPGNPVPGVYYLRHVGFLGAAAPAVRGLKPVSFAAGDEGVVEFSDAWAERQNASLWRQLREWIIGKFGLEEADRALPSYQVATVEDAAREELRQDNTAFAEHGGAGNPKPKGKEAHVEKDKEALAAERAQLATDQAALERDRAAFAERETNFKQAEAARVHAEHVAFAENLVTEGRMLPANKAATVALLDSLASSEATLAYAEESGGKVEKSSLQAMKDMLATSPVVVDYAERAKGGLDAVGSVGFAAPQGFTVDPDGLALHAKAVAYQAEHPGTNYITAIQAVGGK